IIVIEPHPLIRLGILQVLSNLECASSLKGEDYSSFARSRPDNDEPDLVLLSVPCIEDVHDLTAATKRVYAPKAVLLLSDSAESHGPLPELPTCVSGHIPKNSP